MITIIKVDDNGWGAGETFVEITDEKISRGDWYLSLNKKGYSIELCDSEDNSKAVNKLKKYKKIITASQTIDSGEVPYFNIVDIDVNLKNKIND